MGSAAKLKKAAEFVPASELPTPSAIPSRLAVAFGCDLRALAAFRISLGFLTLADLYVRSGGLMGHYTDFGALPRGSYLDLFANAWEISFHQAVGHGFGVMALFAMHTLVAMALIVGWRTRFTSFLAWAFVVSLQNRNPTVLHSGDVVFRMILFWAMFLPLGARASVDAAMVKTFPATAPSNTLLNVATAAALLQIFCEYFFAALFKQGPEWHADGTAIYYALSVEQFSTSIGIWFRESFKWALPTMTRAIYYFELLGPFMLFAPFWRVRLGFVLAFMTMHVGFQVMLGIGTFPFTCIVGLIPFLPTAVFDRFDAWIARRERTGRFLFSPGDEVAERGVRILRELCFLRAAPLVSAVEPGTSKALEYRGELLGDWAFEDENRQTHVGVAGVFAALRASPVFREGVWLLRRWPFRVVIRLAYRFVVAVVGPRAHRWFTYDDNDYRLGTMASATIAALAILCVLWNIDSLGGNLKLVPSWLRPVGQTLRLDQRWNMFSRPIKEDGWYVYEGKLQNGKPFDVKRQTIGAPSFDRPKLLSAEFSDERWQKYLMNLQAPSFEKHRLLYGRYLCRLSNISLPEGEKLETFDLIFVIEKLSPEGRTGNTRQVLWRHNCFDAPPPGALSK